MEKPAAFKNGNVDLRGILHLPGQEESPLTGIIFLHGWQGCRLGPHRMFVKTARDLASMGYCCLRFDFAGRGESGGQTPLTDIQSMISDTKCAINYLKTSHNVKKIILLGICSGGKAAIGTAAQEHGIDGLILWSAEAMGTLKDNSTNFRKSADALLSYARKLCHVQTWKKIFSFKVNTRMVNAAIFRHETSTDREVRDENVLLETFRTFSGGILFVYGENDPAAVNASRRYAELFREMKIDNLMHPVKGANHSFYSLKWEKEVIDVTCRWLCGRKKGEGKMDRSGKGNISGGRFISMLLSLGLALCLIPVNACKEDKPPPTVPAAKSPAPEWILLTNASSYSRSDSPDDSVAGQSFAEQSYSDTFYRHNRGKADYWRAVSGNWRTETVAPSENGNRVEHVMTGRPRENGNEALCLLKGPEWNGCRYSFRLRAVAPGASVAILDRSSSGREELRISVSKTHDGERALAVNGAGTDSSYPLPANSETDVWTSIAIERWAFILRVEVDGRLVCALYDLVPSDGSIGLFTMSDSCSFDDVTVSSINWQSENPPYGKIPWKTALWSRWYRPSCSEGKTALRGMAGRIAVEAPGCFIEEVVIQDTANPCRIATPGLTLTSEDPGRNVRVFQRISSCAPDISDILYVACGTGETGIERLAVRYGKLP